MPWLTETCRLVHRGPVMSEWDGSHRKLKEPTRQEHSPGVSTQKESHDMKDPTRQEHGWRVKTERGS